MTRHKPRRAFSYIILIILTPPGPLLGNTARASRPEEAQPRRRRGQHAKACCERVRVPGPRVAETREASASLS